MAEQLWRGVAAAYDRSFAGLCAGAADALLDRMPTEGRVLDLGCGTGRLTATVAARGYDVVGLDPDWEMLGLARMLTRSPLLVGALPMLPLAQDSFDVILANFVLNHVDDPAAAVSAIPRVVKLGGQVLATIWGNRAAPQATWWNELLDEAGAVRPAMPGLPPDLDFDRTPTGLASLLEMSGLEIEEATAVGWDWRPRHEDLWAGLTTVGNFGVVFRAQTDEVKRRLRSAYDERVGDDLAFHNVCALVSARAGAA